jgi:hypothetical protein
LGRSFPESSARSRGFKFAMLSGIAAYLSKAQTIFVPESGQGALAPALIPVGQAYSDYRNHPLFTGRMAVLLEALFRHKVQFEFPRLWFTKGETLVAYLNANSNAEWSKTRSCWQDNRHASVDGKRRQCGQSEEDQRRATPIRDRGDPAPRPSRQLEECYDSRTDHPSKRFAAGEGIRYPGASREKQTRSSARQTCK